jgi:hypothetical protein
MNRPQRHEDKAIPIEAAENPMQGKLESTSRTAKGGKGKHGRIV